MRILDTRRALAGIGTAAAVVSVIAFAPGPASAATRASATPASATAPTIAITDVYVYSTSVEAMVSVDPGDGGDQSVTMELDPNDDPTAAIVTAPQSVDGTAGPTTLVFFQPNLSDGINYRVSATATDSANDDTTDVYPTDVQPPGVDPTVAQPSVQNISRTSATLHTDSALAGQHGPEEISVQWTTENPGTTTTPTTSSSNVELIDDTFAGPVDAAITGLSPVTGYWARFVLAETTGTDHLTFPTPWVAFETAKDPATVSAPTVSGVSTHGAKVAVTVTAGDVGQTVTVEYGRHSDHSDAVSTNGQSVTASASPTSLVFPLTNLQPGTAYSYRVVSTSDNGDIVDSDWARFTTSKSKAPAVSLKANAPSVVVGHKLRLKWKSARAVTVTAGGAWSGRLPKTSGKKHVKMRKPGTYTFIVAAQNDGGVAIASVTVTAARPAKRLTVSLGHATAKRGGKASVRARGLAAHEGYTIAVSGIEVASGKASAKGVVRKKVRVPAALAIGPQQVKVTGSVATRYGKAVLRLE